MSSHKSEAWLKGAIELTLVLLALLCSRNPDDPLNKGSFCSRPPAFPFLSLRLTKAHGLMSPYSVLFCRSRRGPAQGSSSVRTERRDGVERRSGQGRKIRQDGLGASILQLEEDGLYDARLAGLQRRAAQMPHCRERRREPVVERVADSYMLQA